MIGKYRTKIENLKGQKQKVQKLKNNTEINIEEIKKEIKFSKKAQEIIQQVARETQQNLEYRISNLISLALATVFDDPYNFKVMFEIKRGKTECNLILERDGNHLAPLTGSGGVVDIVSFALRASLWALKNSQNPNSNRNVLILDEPFRNINDPTRELHRRTAEMLKMISDKLKLQIIIITLHQEIKEVASKILEVSIENGISKLDQIEKF